MTATATNNILADAALALRAAGVSIIPADYTDKSPLSRLLPLDPKTQRGTWKPYTTTIVDEERARRWFTTGGARACAVVGGAVSGGLLVIDFDEARFYDPWREAVGTLADGLPVERSGRDGGGFHVFLRCPNPGGNAKLAWIPDDAEDSGRRCAIETRGEGGFCVVSPSDHASGRRYELLSGDLANIPAVTQEVADALLDAARKLCEAPHTRQQLEAMEKRAAAAKTSTRNQASANGSASIIDAWNESQTIEQALEEHGYTRGIRDMWARPGRDAFHVSVTVRDGRSFHHSTNDPLNDGYWHRPFDLLCERDHGSDVKAAVRDAAKRLGLDHNSQKQGTTSEPAGDVGHAEQAPAAPTIVPISAGELLDTFPNLRPPLIEGLIRRGETMNVIAAPKMRKSHLVMELALCTATGKLWLGHFPTTPGRTLVVDNELHHETLSYRLKQVALGMGLTRQHYQGAIDFVALRGRLKDIHELGPFLRSIEPGRYDLIVLDALYRMLPPDAENDNSAIAQVYNVIDGHGDRLGCGFAAVHHTSKGAQGQKSATDTGAGAGSQSRAADAHLVIREHEDADCAVLDAAVRSFAPVPTMGLRWAYPLWRLDGLVDVTRIKRERGAGGRPRKEKPEKEPKPVWTVADLVKLAADQPAPQDVIADRAREAGVPVLVFKGLLARAEHEGQLHKHTFPGDRRNHYATRPQTVAETAGAHCYHTHVPPTPPTGSGGKQRRRPRKPVSRVCDTDGTNNQ
jgi:hypothetical protein